MRRSGEPLRVLSGHRDWVSTAAFSPDGEQIATASADRTTRIWKAASGEELQARVAIATGLTTAAFSPHGEES